MRYMLVLVLLSGCAVQPMSPEQRQAIGQYMQYQHPYVLPMPQPMNVPQQHTYYCSPYGPNTVQCQGN